MASSVLSDLGRLKFALCTTGVWFTLWFTHSGSHVQVHALVHALVHAFRFTLCTTGVWFTQKAAAEMATRHKEVTVLFADIRGFTQRSAEMEPAEVMLMLHQVRACVGGHTQAVDTQCRLACRRCPPACMILCH